jgi:hypothetical protein
MPLHDVFNLVGYASTVAPCFAAQPIKVFDLISCPNKVGAALLLHSDMTVSGRFSPVA